MRNETTSFTEEEKRHVHLLQNPYAVINFVSDQDSLDHPTIPSDSIPTKIKTDEPRHTPQSC